MDGVSMPSRNLCWYGEEMKSQSPLSACASAVSNALLSHLQNAMLSTCNFLN